MNIPVKAIRTTVGHPHAKLFIGLLIELIVFSILPVIRPNRLWENSFTGKNNTQIVLKANTFSHLRNVSLKTVNYVHTLVHVRRIFYCYCSFPAASSEKSMCSILPRGKEI